MQSANSFSEKELPHSFQNTVPTKTEITINPDYLTNALKSWINQQGKQIEDLNRQVAWLHHDNTKLREGLSRFDLLVNSCNNCLHEFDYKQLTCTICGCTNIDGKSYNEDSVIELINENRELKQRISDLLKQLSE